MNFNTIKFSLISFLFLLAACSSSVKYDSVALENPNAPPDSVASFCAALTFHGHRNVNLETCLNTGVLEKDPQTSKMNRYPSASSTPYIFNGKVTQYGRPIRCFAQLRDGSGWTIQRCENASR